MHMNKRTKDLLKRQALNIIRTAKKEQRELTDEEQALLDDTKNEILAVNEKVDEAVAALAEQEKQFEEIDTDYEETKAEDSDYEAAAEVADYEEAKLDYEETKATEEVADDYESSQINNTTDYEEATDTPEPEATDYEESKNKRKLHNIMNKNFSLLRSIRSVVNGKQFDAVDAAVINEGKAEARKAGLDMQGQIQLPAFEKRTLTVNTEHDDVIETEFEGILEPLYSKSVLNEIGATMYTGCVGDIQIPVMAGNGGATWAGETEDVNGATNTFTNIKLQPKRLSVVIPISNQILIQDSIGVETAVRNDIINSLNAKLQDTIFGAGDGKNTAGDVVAPVGILNGKTSTTCSTFADVTALESTVEGANIFGECKYLLSPTAKASLRALNYGGKTTALVMQGDEVDGTKALTSNCVNATNGVAASKEFIYGDFSNLAVAFWKNADILVDPYTLASTGVTRLICSIYVDAKVLRDAAFAYGKMA